MFGIGELVLLLLVLVFAGGAASRLAGWALFRRFPGAKGVLSVLLEPHAERSEGRADDEDPPSDRTAS